MVKTPSSSLLQKKIKKHVLNDGKDFKDGNDNVL
jgi:hypothetical protein